MIQLSQIADKIFDFAKIGKLPSFILAFISWIFVLLPIPAQKTLQIENIITNHKSYLGFSAVLFSSYFVAFTLYEILSAQILERRTIQIIKRRIRNLSEDEKLALREFIEHKKRTASFHMSQGIAEGLVAKKILYRPSTLSLSHDLFSYNIQDAAYDYLMKNKQLLQ